MNHKIKFAIFDVGQTIYPFSLLPLTKYMQQETTRPDIFINNHSPRFYDYNPYMKGKLTNEEFAEELCFFCQVPYNKKRLEDINLALHQGCGQPFPETMKTMDMLHKNNIEICLLSNALPLLADTGTHFSKPEFAFTSYDLHLLKPDIEIFLAVQKKLQVPFEQILFIDDKKKNVNTAKSLGIKGIIYNRPTILKEVNAYLQPLPTIRRSREE